MSGVLDDGAALARFDPQGMLEAVATLPAQIRDGWARTRDLEFGASHREAQSVAVLGMGGSAVGADLVRGVFSGELRVPLVTVRDYELPAWVGPSTLALAASYSGATEETVTCFAEALERKCPVAVITTGGPLGEVARQAKLPLLEFPGGGQPRAAVGYSVLLLAGLLEKAGLLAAEETDVEEAARASEVVLKTCGPKVVTEQNPAKQLAWSLVDRLPVICGSGALAPVARRWKTQLNENAKTIAVADELPELTHNSVVGFGGPEALRERMFFVFLAGPADHPRNSLRAALAADALASVQVSHQTVPVAGESRLAQAMAAVTLGDLVSVYLAFLYGLDPSPVEAIGRIKARLSPVEEDPDD
jgi:glucose/mannose-6-phosphate isomerase